ncbi:MAG: aspartyl/glutamyl-tRNA amidotransferase subunit C [bacterium]|nr:aspartyl/glutamyl-tRNA amidotransferase subunit C [bacterium]
MGKFTKEMVNDYANKLLIGLTEKENKLVLDEFEEIDQAISLINEIPNISDVEIMTHALDNFNYVLREDIIEESISIEDFLKNCDNNNGEEPIVPKVVG